MLSKLLINVTDQKEMEAVLDAILTSKEREEIENRLQIYQMLAEGTAQREIATRLGVGIATVTRGAKAFREGKFASIEKHLG